MLTACVHHLQALLFSALSCCEESQTPYPTAYRMGEQPLSKQQFSALRRETLRSSTLAAGRRNDPEVTSAVSQHQQPTTTTKYDLSKTVFYGRWIHILSHP